MKKLLTTILLIASLALLAEGLYRLLFFQHDRDTYSEGIMDLVHKIDDGGADILYLGESSNHSWHFEDVDTSWISHIIAQRLPDLKVLDMTHDASHAEVYYQMLRNLDPSTPVGTVVVTMNLRSFGVDWIYSALETALQKKLVMLKARPALVNRAVLSFKAYDIKDVPERYRQMDHYWERHPLPGHPSVPRWGDSLNTDSLTLAGAFVRNYAFIIDTLHNPRIRDFDNIVALSKQRGWNLVFNLLAENVEQADSLAGPDLPALMRQNRDILMRRYNRDGVMVVDNLECVADSLFRDRDWPTEHYRYEGRRIVADNVARTIRVMNIEY